MMSGKSFLIVQVLFLFIFGSETYAASRAATNASNGMVGANAAYNGKKSKEHHEKCQQLASAGQQQQAKAECAKGDASGGQMLGSLAQLLAGLASQGAQSDDSGGGDFALAETPQTTEEFLADPVEAEKTLTGVGLSSGEARDILDAAALANSRGVGFDPSTGTVSTSSGDFSLASLSTPEGLSALGYTGEEIQELVKEQESIAKGLVAKVKSLDFDGGSGGGSKTAKKYNYHPEDFELPDFGGKSLLEKLGHKDGKRVFSRNLAGQPIGVSTSSIFQMLSRRYQIKQKSNSFLP